MSLAQHLETQHGTRDPLICVAEVGRKSVISRGTKNREGAETRVLHPGVVTSLSQVAWVGA